MKNQVIKTEEQNEVRVYTLDLEQNMLPTQDAQWKTYNTKFEEEMIDFDYNKSWFVCITSNDEGTISFAIVRDNPITDCFVEIKPNEVGIKEQFSFEPNNAIWADFNEPLIECKEGFYVVEFIANKTFDSIQLNVRITRIKK